MNCCVADRTIIVTGAASGIGKACADYLINGGNRLVLMDLAFDSLSRAFPEKNENLLLVEADISREQDCARAVAAATVAVALRRRRAATLARTARPPATRPGRRQHRGAAAARHPAAAVPTRCRHMGPAVLSGVTSGMPKDSTRPSTCAVPFIRAPGGWPYHWWLACRVFRRC